MGSFWPSSSRFDRFYRFLIVLDHFRSLLIVMGLFDCFLCLINFVRFSIDGLIVDHNTIGLRCFWQFFLSFLAGKSFLTVYRFLFFIVMSVFWSFSSFSNVLVRHSRLFLIVFAHTVLVWFLQHVIILCFLNRSVPNQTIVFITTSITEILANIKKTNTFFEHGKLHIRVWLISFRLFWVVNDRLARFLSFW